MKEMGGEHVWHGGGTTPNPDGLLYASQLVLLALQSNTPARLTKRSTAEPLLSALK